MAATATIRLTATVTGLAAGELTVGPLEIQSTAAVGERRSPLDLSIGDNTIAVPAAATMALFIPPSANAQAITLKGVSGDTGVRLHKTKPSLLTMDAAANATLVLNAAGAVAGCELIFF